MTILLICQFGRASSCVLTINNHIYHKYLSNKADIGYFFMQGMNNETKMASKMAAIIMENIKYSYFVNLHMHMGRIYYKS